MISDGPRRAPLTIGKLKEWIRNYEEHRGEGTLDDLPIHLMVMDDESSDNADSRFRFATHVETDRFDDEGGDCVSIVVWNSKP